MINRIDRIKPVLVNPDMDMIGPFSGRMCYRIFITKDNVLSSIVNDGTMRQMAGFMAVTYEICAAGAVLLGTVTLKPVGISIPDLGVRRMPVPVA